MRPRLVLLALLCAAACDRFGSNQDPPPSPQTKDVCEHVVRIAAKSEGAAIDSSTLTTDCSAALERVRKHYDTLSACLLNTNTMDEILACEQPMRTWTSVISGSSLGPKPDEVCKHVMGIMKRELGEALPMSDSDTQKFHEECVKEMNAELAKMGAAEFRKQAGCVLEAKSLADMERCDKKK